MDIRQSSYFADYMRSIGWQTKKLGENIVYLRSIPILGTFAKLHRPSGTISFGDLQAFKKDHHLHELAVEPSLNTVIISRTPIKKNNSPYLPTKTIVIDITKSEKILLQNFTDAKKRGLKKAEKKRVIIKTGTIRDFAKLKQKDYLFPLGLLMGKDLQKLYDSFPKQQREVLVAYETNDIVANEMGSQLFDSGQARMTKPIAAILLFFYNKTAYYWMAVATKKGKELHAPTQLVWYSILEAKKRGCTVFDFDGIYDKRFHKATENWLGFTKFKEGFGGREIEFPTPFIV